MDPAQRWMCVIGRHHLKVGSSSTTIHLGHCIEGQGRTQHTQLFIFPGRRNEQRCRSIQIHRLCQMVWVGGSRIQKKRIGKLVKRRSGDEVCGYISLRAKNIQIFVSHVKAHQRITSAHKDFNNQMTKMTHLWMTVRRFPSHICHCSMG